MKKRWLALCLATVMAASLTACGSSKTSTPDTTGTQTTAAGSETKAGGETKAEEAPAGAVEQVVTIPMFSDPDTLDPGRSDDEQKNAIVLEIQETLIRLMDGKVTPGGAESWETSDDGLVWTFKLRDNQYSDGTAVTAQDYVTLFAGFLIRKSTVTTRESSTASKAERISIRAREARKM